MKVTINWLKDFLDTDELDALKIAELLTMSGTEVEKIEFTQERFKNIAIGRIINFSKHPDADKLSVCNVDIGSKLLSIVCGASNFKNNDLVPVALEGAILGNFEIKKSKIRGIYSEGMICSEQELGISNHSDGIMILNGNLNTGNDFSKEYLSDDIILDLEITPNRPDCLSIIGIAREISALTGYKLKIPDYKKYEKKLNINKKLKIEIEDYTLCPRYSAGIFKNVNNFDSPIWLKNRLIMCGIRSINLIVDLTNYVMLETGQPLHAFDRDLLFSEKIIIRRAKKGETIVTIDDSKRILDMDDIVIADVQKPVALAGIMGGKNTEINPDTHNVLLEAANFYGPSIMKTSKRLGLRSEASNRFEKKIDPLLTVFAIERFTHLLSQITGIENGSCVYDNYERNERKRIVKLYPEKLHKSLGRKIDVKDISHILSGLGIANRTVGRHIESIIPSFRYEDLEREVDLIEEIARIYGFDKFDPIPLKNLEKRGRFNFFQKNLRFIRQSLCDIGLNEVINYSFISRQDYKTLNLDAENEYNKIISIINPINEDFKIMRPLLLPSLIRNINSNINRNLKDMALFEISKTFKKTESDELPEENYMLGIILTGRYSCKEWNSDQKDYDFFYLKGILEFICKKVLGNYYLIRISEKEYSFFNPSISGDLEINKCIVGKMGSINPLILESSGIKQDVFYLELKLKEFMNLAKVTKKYKPISSYPSIDIDLALVVDKFVKNEDLVKAIKKRGSNLLEEVRLFDIYQGQQVEKDKKSMAYSLSFRDKNRTLKDTEVEVLINKILENLKKEFDIELRK